MTAYLSFVERRCITQHQNRINVKSSIFILNTYSKNKNLALQNTTYRKLKPGESAIYRAIRLESLKNYPDSFGSTYEDTLRIEKLGYETYIEESNPDNLVIGAFHEDELIGICGFFRMEDERCIHRGVIIQMYVKPDYHGKQVGLGLINATITEVFEIPGIEQIELGVMATNIAAHKIYLKAGFTECGLQKNIYKKKGVYHHRISMVLYRDDLS